MKSLHFAIVMSLHLVEYYSALIQVVAVNCHTDYLSNFDYGRKSRYVNLLNFHYNIFLSPKMVHKYFVNTSTNTYNVPQEKSSLNYLLDICQINLYWILKIRTIKILQLPYTIFINMAGSVKIVQLHNKLFVIPAL